MKKIFFYCAAAAALTLSSCSNEEVMELNKSNAISFRASFNEGVTGRGTETSTESLNQFVVTALDADAEYQAYFSNLLFEKQGAFFESNPQYMWTQKANLDFYAYGYALKSGTVFDKLLNCNADIEITKDQQTINNFRPNTNIADQIDLVYAFTQSKITTGSVSLSFDHILSEVAVEGTHSSSLYNYEVLGLRYGNVGAQGDYDMGKRTWTIFQDNYPCQYEIIYDKPITISGTGSTDLSDVNKTGYAMFIPHKQRMVWSPSFPEGGGEYIGVLLRITMQDNPDLVKFPRTTPDNPYVYEYKASGEENEGIMYGWAYFPIPHEIDWLEGHRYIYTIDFTHGAGYDPGDGGKPVLEHRIYISADVKEWTNAGKTPLPNDFLNNNK